ncbi:response regulator transcription factor [Hydrogenimonas sp.]
MKEKAAILIVEDDLLSAEYLKEILQSEGHEVLDILDTAEAAIDSCERIEPDIVLMDVMLRGRLSGSEAAVEIGRRRPHSKIIFLSAYADSEMVDYAVRSRAFAYLMKPYREREILATVKVALGYDETTPRPREDVKILPLAKGFRFDLESGKLFRDDGEIPLTEKKRKLIELLAKNRNVTVSNERICMEIWHEPKSDNTIRSLVHRLRQAIGEDIVVNVNGIGYTLVTE